MFKRKINRLNNTLETKKQALYNYQGTIEEYQRDAEIIENIRKEKQMLCSIVNEYVELLGRQQKLINTIYEQTGTLVTETK